MGRLEWLGKLTNRLAIGFLLLAACSDIERSMICSASEPKEAHEFIMMVMDPLSAPLACDCVKGYANRQYQRLGDYLQERLSAPVRVVWSESLEEALAKESRQSCDLVIGKDSVVIAQGKEAGLRLRGIASLTDLQGSTKQHGLFVVRSNSESASVLDLEGHQIFFGTENCDEKWLAPKRLLEELEVSIAKSQVFGSCSEAAKALMALPADAKAAAVISSYAQPLLEGCGTIKKGDLRVVGKTDDLRFISAFVNHELPTEQQQAIEAAILSVSDPELLKALESENGFVPYDAKR